MNLALGLIAVAATAVQGSRWLRVAQREHYHPVVWRFALRWWSSTPANAGLCAIAVLATAASVFQPLLGFVVAVVVGAAPIGLGVVGRTSRLAWTSRMRATAMVAFALAGAVIAVGVVAGAPAVIAIALLGFPSIVDAALVMWRPVQARLDRRWVEQARDGLERSGARVVAITGSFGKTTTKGYLAHLLADRAAVTASPASFNNRMGLARAVNEHVGTGTEIFIAEMGTYGPGEIADMCSWIPPEVAVITALGPVHLERMGSVEGIGAAKREIFDRATVGVISIDHPVLARIADEESRHRRMITVSVTGAEADVVGDPETGEIVVDGVPVGRVDPADVVVSNVACAIGAVLALGFDLGGLEDRVAGLPTPPHRQVVSTTDRGVRVIDDTFNSNPAGASRALDLLELVSDGRRVLVTPGMVELGHLQDRENEAFARKAATIADDIVIVGFTNRRSLRRGAEASDRVSVHCVATRDDAVDWVRRELGAGDAVLYENDLPDHYP